MVKLFRIVEGLPQRLPILDMSGIAADSRVENIP